MTPIRLAALWSLLILTVCSIPGESVPFQFLPISFDKLVHLGLFAIFGALWLRARPGKGWTIFMVGTAFGIAIELWQGTALIGRSPDPLDALADTVGLGLGLGLWSWLGNDSMGGVSG